MFNTSELGIFLLSSSVLEITVALHLGQVSFVQRASLTPAAVLY